MGVGISLMVSLGVSVLLRCESSGVYLVMTVSFFRGMLGGTVYILCLNLIIGVFLRVFALWHISVVSALWCLLGEWLEVLLRGRRWQLDGVFSGFCGVSFLPLYSGVL